jgi:predicted DNA binding CopG/RHH family protein
MKKIDPFEKEIVEAYETGVLRSAMPSKSELRALREAARATAIKDRRVNIRLSSPDLTDLRTRALEEGLPYQTLIASVLHKFVAGRLVEKPTGPPHRSTRTAVRRRASPPAGSRRRTAASRER